MLGFDIPYKITPGSSIATISNLWHGKANYTTFFLVNLETVRSGKQAQLTAETADKTAHFLPSVANNILPSRGV